MARIVPRGRGQALAAALALLALAPAGAGASTVTVRGDPEAVNAPSTPPFADQVFYAAAPGEVNDVTVAYTLGEPVTVTDPGATITAADGCVSLDAHTARCEPMPERKFGLRPARVELGDGDDRAVSTRPAGGPPIGGIVAFGGTGDDVLIGSPTADHLDGGGGTDELTGGAGNDDLADGDTAGATDADVLDGGGGGFDMLDYSSHTAAVAVALDEGTAGAAGEGDAIRAFEGVTGGAGDDRLSGRPGAPDLLVGGPGDDRLEGRGGRTRYDTDVLRGEDGDDVLVGTDSPELFTGGDGADDVRCAGGSDTITIERDEYVHTGCERLVFGGILVPSHPVAMTSTQARFEIACLRPEELDGEAAPCSGRLTLREVGGARRRLGAREFDRRFELPFSVGVRLTRTGRRLARRRRGVIVAVTIRGRVNLPDIRWQMRLRHRSGG